MSKHVRTRGDVTQTIDILVTKRLFNFYSLIKIKHHFVLMKSRLQLVQEHILYNNAQLRTLNLVRIIS